MGSLYDLLGVQRDANLNEIKRAYRRLAKELHPDINVGDDVATERFKRITAAYNLLANKHKRAEFDQNTFSELHDDQVQPWQMGGTWLNFEIDESTGERTIDQFGDVAGTRLGRVKGGSGNFVMDERRRYSRNAGDFSI